MFDWSGVYLSTQTSAAAGVAPLGLAAFSLCMGLGRLIGDRVVAHFDSPLVVRGGALLAALGLGLALARPNPAAAITGFALMGLGLSTVFPLSLRSSAWQGQPPGPALAAVSTVGYAGFLAGPPLIGLLAGATGLRAALVVVCILCLLAATLAHHVTGSNNHRRPATLAHGHAQ